MNTFGSDTFEIRLIMTQMLLIISIYIYIYQNYENELIFRSSV